ncbi:hypothetical protein ACVOMT_08610 [Sphingomonas panni]
MAESIVVRCLASAVRSSRIAGSSPDAAGPSCASRASIRAMSPVSCCTVSSVVARTACARPRRSSRSPRSSLVSSATSTLPSSSAARSSKVA